MQAREKSISVFIAIISLVILIGVPGLIMAHGWKAPEEAAARPNPIAADSGSLARGMELYATYCAGCHGEQGRGDGVLVVTLTAKPADLAARAAHHSGGDFAWKIATGRGEMPGFKNKLTEAQIWDLVNFIKGI